jgi:hypothetical protein
MMRGNDATQFFLECFTTQIFRTGIIIVNILTSICERRRGMSVCYKIEAEQVKEDNLRSTSP